MPMFRGRANRIHFVGIGGIGMSGIAEVLLSLNYAVSGSDLRETDVTRRLVEHGATVHEGHRASHVTEVDVVVVSSAVPETNPEVAEARRLGIPVIPRAEMLAELMRLKYGIAIAGSHGKTTTTSLVAHLLLHADLDPTVVVGGKVNHLGSSARLGQGEYLVAEADESDGSFLVFAPTIAVVTNIDAEHMEHYGSMDVLRDSFVRFINRVPFYGLAVLCLDHPEVQHLIPKVDKRYVTYGFSSQASWHARDVQSSAGATDFEVIHDGESLGRFHLPMVGEHNILNSLAALAVADEMGVTAEQLREGLATFEGVQRRFTIRGEASGITVVDDYGHHPTEIQAVLEGARHAYDRRIVAIFQPHRYTRTRDCIDGFAVAFNEADKVVVTDVYAAGEAPIEGYDAARVVDAIRGHGHRDVTRVGDLGQVAGHLEKELKDGDLVITFGAGDVWKVGLDLLELLAEDASDETPATPADKEDNVLPGPGAGGGKKR